MSEKCSRCSGSGQIYAKSNPHGKYGYHSCYECGGSGKKSRSTEEYSTDDYSTDSQEDAGVCPTCSGHGSFQGTNPCPTCGAI